MKWVRTRLSMRRAEGEGGGGEALYNILYMPSKVEAVLGVQVHIYYQVPGTWYLIHMYMYVCTCHTRRLFLGIFYFQPPAE